MSDEKKYDNSGILFRNDDKQGEKSPDYKGNMTVGGTEFWLSAWIKEGKRGKFLSLSLKRKDGPKAVAAQASSAAPYDDEIPF